MNVVEIKQGLCDGCVWRRLLAQAKPYVKYASAPPEAAMSAMAVATSPLDSIRLVAAPRFLNAFRFERLLNPESRMDVWDWDGRDRRHVYLDDDSGHLEEVARVFGYDKLDGSVHAYLDDVAARGVVVFDPGYFAHRPAIIRREKAARSAEAEAPQVGWYYVHVFSRDAQTVSDPEAVVYNTHVPAFSELIYATGNVADTFGANVSGFMVFVGDEPWHWPPGKPSRELLLREVRRMAHLDGPYDQGYRNYAVLHIHAGEITLIDEE